MKACMLNLSSTFPKIPTTWLIIVLVNEIFYLSKDSSAWIRETSPYSSVNPGRTRFHILVSGHIVELYIHTEITSSCILCSWHTHMCMYKHWLVNKPSLCVHKSLWCFIESFLRFDNLFTRLRIFLFPHTQRHMKWPCLQVEAMLFCTTYYLHWETCLSWTSWPHKQEESLPTTCTTKSSSQDLHCPPQ